MGFVDSKLTDRSFSLKSSTHEEAVLDQTDRMTLRKLLNEARVSPLSTEGDLDVEITGIQQDSRLVAPGDLFVCVKGLKSDGHQFAIQAIEKGAVAIISLMEVSLTEGLKAAVIVEDTSVILSALAGTKISS